MANRRGKGESSDRLYFLGQKEKKITAYGNYSHEITGHLLLRRKAMTNLDSVFKNKHYFVDKVMSLLFNVLSRLVIIFLSRSKHLLISWLQSPSAVTLEPPKIV